MGHYALSPSQPPSVAQEATTAPHLDLTTAPCRLPVYARLGPNRGTRGINRSPSPDSPGPPTFAQHLQQAPFPPRFNGRHGKGKAKRQDQDEGPSTQREKRIERIAADWPAPHRSPRLITRARSPSRTLQATSMSSWRARAQTMNTPSNTSTRTASSSSAFYGRPADQRKKKAKKQ